MAARAPLVLLVVLEERSPMSVSVVGSLRRAGLVLCRSDLESRIRPWLAPDAVLRVVPDGVSWPEWVPDAEPRKDCVACVVTPDEVDAVRARLPDAGHGVRTVGKGWDGAVVLGPVVEADAAPAWLAKRPLAGWRVLVTRPEHQAPDLEHRLEERGAEPVRFPVIRIEPPADPDPIRRAVAGLAEYQWLLFTSANAVRAFHSQLSELGKDARDLAGIQVAAIGSVTARALGGMGLTADLVPAEFVAESLLDALKERSSWSGVSVLLPRAREARDVLPEGLRALGARVDVVEAYRTEFARADDVSRLLEALESGEIDLVTFTASSTVWAFHELVGTLGRARGVAIGPITAGTARDVGLAITGVAAEYTIEGLVQACEMVASRRSDETDGASGRA